MRGMAVLFVFLSALRAEAQAPISIDEMRVGNGGLWVYAENDVARGKPVEGKVSRIIDKDSLVVRLDYTAAGKFVVVRHPTAELVDDQRFDLTMPLKVTGTRRLGTRTMLYLEPWKAKK